MTLDYKRPGDKRIPAADWNKIIDATRLVLGSGPAPSLAVQSPLAGMVETVHTTGENVMLPTIENPDGVTLYPGDCVVIVGYSLAEIERGPVVQVALKSIEYDASFLAVALDVILPGLSGPVAIYGLAWAKFTPGTGSFGTLADGDTTLQPSTSGPAQILHTRADGFALIRFPVGGGGGGGVGASIQFDFYGRVLRDDE